MPIKQGDTDGGKSNATVAKKSLAVLNAEKYPYAASLNKTLAAAKAKGINRERMGRPPTKTTFRSGEPRPKRLTALEKFVEYVGESRSQRIFEKLISMAEEGDMQAMTLAIDRLAPKGKLPRTIIATTKDIMTLADIDEASIELADKMSRGEADIDDGKLLLESYKIVGEMGYGRTQEALEDITQKLADKFGDDVVIS